MASNFQQRSAKAYDDYMGRWSRRLAPKFLDFAGVATGERILDMGCGTGSLTLELAARPDLSAIEAIDFEETFVAALRENTTDPRITARQGDAVALPFPDSAFDRVLSMLVLHFVSDAAKAVTEMRRVLRPGGVAAATVWDTYGGMPTSRIFWDCVATLEPSALARRASLLRPMTQQGELRDAFASAGLAAITEAMLVIRMEFATFEDYWQPQLTGQGTKAYFDSLTAEMQDRVREAVRQAYLCGRPDGPRSFASVAWAVRGRAPDGS